VATAAAVAAAAARHATAATACSGLRGAREGHKHLRRARDDAGIRAVRIIVDYKAKQPKKQHNQLSARCIKQSMFQQQYTRHNAVKCTDMEIANLVLYKDCL
jgi:hypothetical protein